MWLFPCFAPCVEWNPMINQPSQRWNVSYHLADCHDISSWSNHHLVVFHWGLHTPYIYTQNRRPGLFPRFVHCICSGATNFARRFNGLWLCFFVLSLSLSDQIIPVLVIAFTDVFASLVLPLKCNSFRITWKEEIMQWVPVSQFRRYAQLLELKKTPKKHKHKTWPKPDYNKAETIRQSEWTGTHKIYILNCFQFFCFFCSFLLNP